MQNQNIGGDHHGIGSHPLSSAQSRDLHKDVQREIEKERIRQEIIMSEILRRRELEAEVRRELKVEMELALWGGSNGFYGSPPRTELDLTTRLPLVVAERSFLEERMVQSLTQTENLSNRYESRLSESLKFRSVSDDVRLVRSSEVEPGLEVVKEKKKINIQANAMENITKAAKASENVTGVKRALSDCSPSENSNTTKKTKEEWRCDICQISTTGECSLNEHLKGKKHKIKEAAPRAQNGSRAYSIGLSNQKATKPIVSDPDSNNEVKLTSEHLPYSMNGDASSVVDKPPPLQEDSDILEKNDKECTDDLPLPERVEKNEESVVEVAVKIGQEVELS